MSSEIIFKNVDEHLDEMEDDEDELNEILPIRIGDYITLRGLNIDGFLCGEGVLEDGVILSKSPSRFDDCIFQVCLANQYSAAKELATFKQQMKNGNIDFSDEEDESEEKLNDEDEDEDEEMAVNKERKFLAALERGMANEIAMNAKQMESNLGTQIKFGQTIQLKHRKSQKFLTVDSMVVATAERENLRVYLSDTGNSLSWFTLKPWFKIDRENAEMESNSAVLLQVAERSQEQVHCSEMSLTKGKDKDREVNCSLDRTGWRMCVYSEYHEGGKDLFAGEIVQLYDPEKLTYLTLLEEGKKIRVDAFLEVQSHREVNSNYLWMLERHKNPSAGGKAAYGNHTFRLRHLNSGKYLCCRPVHRWKSSRKALKSMLDINQEESTEDPNKLVYASTSQGRIRACALKLMPAQMHMAARQSNMGSQVMYITDQSAVTIDCAGQWLHRGARHGNTEVFTTHANPNQKGSLALVIQRFQAPDSTMTEIMVGVAALPFLRRYVEVTQKHQQHQELWAPNIFPQYLKVVKQLVNFLCQISLAQPTDFDEVDEKLQTLKVEDIRFRQQLLREQGVLSAILSVLEHLMSERTNRIANAGTRVLPTQNKRGKRGNFDFEALKRDIAEASCWLLRLAILENPTSQMFIADHLATLIEYVPLDGQSGLATKCITHMLSTNVELQETKVKDSDIEHFIDMIRSSQMSAAYLDLLRSVCSCQGRGVDGNQCRVVDLWLQGSEDLNMELVTDSQTPWIPPSEIHWFKPIDTNKLDLIMGSTLLKHGLPRLRVKWQTETEELKPSRFAPDGDSHGVPLETLFMFSQDKAIQRLQKYFVSQLYLGAEICLDRNYLAMGILEKQFPFDLCMAVLKNPSAPSVLKAAFTRLVACVYVDADPQNIIRIPRLSHSFEDIDVDQGYSLPDVSESEKYKFLCLQDLISENLNQLSQSGWDQYTRQQMALLLQLVQFRFYSSSEQFHELVRPLVESLDCRGQDPEADASKLFKRPSVAMVYGRASMVPGQVLSKSASVLPSQDSRNQDEEEARARPPNARVAERERRLHQWKHEMIKIYDVLDSVPVLILILLLVFAGIILSISTMTGGANESAIGIVVFEYCASAIYLIELTVRMYVYTYKFGEGDPTILLKKFVWDIYNVVDIAVVLIDLVMYSYGWIAGGGGGGTQAFAKAGRALRLARLTRIAKAARLINKFNEDGLEEEEPEWEIPRRYIKTTTRQLQTMLQMIRVLAEVSSLSRDYTLGTTLTTLKQALQNESFDVPFETKDGDAENGTSREVTLFSDCVEQSKDLSLNQSGAAFDEVFLDLCLYAHSELVQAALNVLMVHHSTRQFLLTDLSGAQLIDDPNEAADFRRLRGELMELQSAAEKHELWGELESEEDHAMNARTKTILRSLARACYRRHQKPNFYGAYTPCRKYQDMIRHLGGFETAMTVLGLHASIADTEDMEVAENTRELLKLCNIFLSWFISNNLENQNLAYEEIQFWLDTLDEGILSGQVVADIMRGNAELIRQIPVNIINFLAEQIIKNGHNADYLLILEAMVFLEDFEGDNNTEVQFTILSELARSGRAERTMWLCGDKRGDDFSTRVSMMEEAKEVMIRGDTEKEDKTLQTDSEHLSPQLAYHCKLLDVLAGCAYGRINVTTVETKLQNMLNPEACLWGLLDPKTSLDVAGPLAAYFFHVVVEVEIAVPGLGQNLLMWEFLERMPKHLNAASSILSQPIDALASADGPIGIKSRQQLMYTWFCIRIFTVFFKNYYSMALRHECADDLRTSPTSMDFYATRVKRMNEMGSSVYEDEQQDQILHLDLDHDESRPASAAQPPVSEPLLPDQPLPCLEDDESALDLSIVSAEETDSLALMLDEDSDDDEEEEVDEKEEHWIDKLIQVLHTQAVSLLEKHQRTLYARDQSVLLDGVTALRSVYKFPNITELPAIIPDPVDEVGSAQESLQNFVHELSESEVLEEQINNDRTKIVELIETLPRIRDIDIEADLRFEPLIGKLVSHARSRLTSDGTNKKLDPECTKTTIWIVQLFRRMIEKKWGMTIDERDDDGGEEEDIAAEPIVQVLNKYGVTTLCIDLIAVGVDGTLVLEAIKLSVAMLFKEGGNQLVQSTMNKHLNSTNSELFFREIQLQISRIKRFYEFEEIPPCEDEDDDPTVPENLIVLRFLQLMSEGHFEPNQEVVRDQPNNVRSVNLLEDFVGLFNVCSQHPSRSATATADAVTATILEVIQGPCIRNQEYFAVQSELIEIMNRVLRSPLTGDCLLEEEDGVKKTVLEIFEGLTEGQGKNSVVFDRILSVIDVDVIQVMVQAVPHGTDLETSEKANQMSEIQIEGLVLLQMFMDYQPALANEIKLPRRIKNQMGKDVVSVEVVWNGKLQRRFFPVPAICGHIAEATKQKLVEEVDRSSQDAKLQDFVHLAKDIYREVNHQQWLSEQEWFGWNLAQLFSRRNQENVTWMAFFCALTINVLFLFTYEHKQGWIARMSEDDFQTQFGPVSSWPHGIVKDSDIYFGKNNAIIAPLVFVMNIINIALSAFTLILFIVVRCPVKYQKIMEETSTPEWKALLTTATDVMTMYYLFYTLVAVLSMSVESAMHPFLLLDVIVKESTTRDVVKAVVHPIKQLSAAMVLGVFVIYIFAMITFKNFASDFTYDGDFDDAMSLEDASAMNDDCRTLWGCFKVSANYGMRLSGGTGDIMTHTLEGERLLLDLLYFLIVLVVLLNIIFGIIIDTFSDLRTQKLERLKDTTDKCFICGIDGFTFDQASSEPGSAFRRHIKNDHYMWNYLNFIIFIWQQDKDDDDGMELYVRRMLDRGECVWFPSGRALCLQGGEDAEETVAEHIEKAKSDLQVSLHESHSKQISTISEISVNLSQSIQKVHDAINSKAKSSREGERTRPATSHAGR